MAKAQCKCKPTECEECPEWIFTFADLVMLMMGFFVILWVLKPPPGKDGEAPKALSPEVVGAIREAFGYVPDPNSNDPIDQAILMKGLHMKKPRGPVDGGKTTTEQDGAKGAEPEVEMVRPSKQVGTGTKVLFAPGDATLSPESRHALDEIAGIIRGHRNIYMVKGHASTDDYPDGADESLKMALSLRRAQVAADYLIAKGIDRETVRVQGCSTFEPVVQRAYTPDAKTLNRRVEVESTGTLVRELQDNTHPAAKMFPLTTQPEH
jgi:outer membrane protein OmpA-like peptidoglycan-associated protein